jgi:hypothetical protein
MKTAKEVLEKGEIVQQNNLTLTDKVNSTSALSNAIKFTNKHLFLDDLQGPFQYQEFSDDSVFFYGKIPKTDFEIVLEILSNKEIYNNPDKLDFDPDKNDGTKISQFDPTFNIFERLIKRIYERQFNGIYSAILPIASNKKTKHNEETNSPYFKSPLFYPDIGSPHHNLANEVAEINRNSFNGNSQIFFSYLEKELITRFGKKLSYFFNIGEGEIRTYKFETPGTNIAYPYTPLLKINPEYGKFFIEGINFNDEQTEVFKEFLEHQEKLKYWINDKKRHKINGRPYSIKDFTFELKKGLANIVKPTYEQIQDIKSLKALEEKQINYGQTYLF